MATDVSDEAMQIRVLTRSKDCGSNGNFRCFGRERLIDDTWRRRYADPRVRWSGDGRLTLPLLAASFRNERSTIVVHPDIDRACRLSFAHHHVRFPTRGMS